MEQTNTSPIFLGFSSQKGGVGKSTLAEIVSSILYYEKGFELFIVDCDLSQDSFYKLRQREKTFVEGDPLVSEQMNNYFSALGRVSYRVLKADPKSAIAKADEYIRKNSKKRFDLVVFDFPDMRVRATCWNSHWKWTISFPPSRPTYSRWSPALPMPRPCRTWECRWPGHASRTSCSFGTRWTGG